MSKMENQNENSAVVLSDRVQGFIQRVYRDPRYLLLGKVERFGRELVAFVEGCTIISATGEVRGQALINSEYELRNRPDGQRPYDRSSLVDHYLSPDAKKHLALGEDDIAALRDESWQYYVRRNFAFLLEDFALAREDAEHNLAICDLVDQAEANETTRWAYLRWWPWIERDRAIAQALLWLKGGQPEHAATELYRAQRGIQQFGERHADCYARESSDGKPLCEQMQEHIASLVEMLREEGLPVSMDEQLDAALSRGDEEEIERLRKEMIQQTVSEDE